MITPTNSSDKTSLPHAQALQALVSALGLLLGSFVLMAWLETQPVAGRSVAVVFPPWWNAVRSTDAVIAADGAIMGWGILGSIVLARSDQSDFPDRLYAAGAVVVTDQGNLIFCGQSDQTASASRKNETR